MLTFFALLKNTSNTKNAGSLCVQAVEKLKFQKTFREESALKLFSGKKTGYYCKYRHILGTINS